MSTQFTNRQWRLPNNENKDKQSNYSMVFDGSSQYIDTTDKFDFIHNTKIFSISVWVKMDSYNTNVSSVILGNNYTSSQIGFQFWIDNRQNAAGRTEALKFNLWDGTNSSDLLEDNVVSDNNWHNYVVVGDGTTLKYYKDGTQLTDTDSLPASTSSTAFANLRLGANTISTPSSYLDGKLDAVAIFNYALTDGTGGTVNQIAALYGSSSTGIGNPITLNPVAYYQLGDKSAFNGANYLVPNSSLKDYVFDFDADYIDLGSSSYLNSAQNVTVSAWINSDNYSSGSEQNILNDWNHPTANGHFRYDITSTGVLRISVKIDGSNYAANEAQSFTFTNGRWYNVVFVYDGTLTGNTNICKLYIDGQPQTVTNLYENMPSSFLSSSSSLNIGRFGSSSHRYFNGKISNVQIFNTSLSSTEAETLYNNGSPIETLANIPQNSNLQGWWKLDASATYDSSTNTWSIPDDSTNSNTGTSSGMTQANLVQSDLSFTSGYSPYALDFDGTNDYINIASAGGIALMNTGVSSTVSLWVYPTGTSTRVFFEQKSTGRYVIYQSGTSLFFYPNSARASFTNLILNQWYNVTTIVDGSNSKFYVNGNEVGTSTSYTPVNTLGVLQFGRSPAGIQYFEGKLSNVSIWNTALTSSQVTEIYNEGVPSNLNNHSAYSNLVSWWQLGSNSSFNTNWTVLDEKGSNNGTSVNMTEDDIVDGVGSYANGLSSGMGGDEVIGSAPFSDANSLSINMDVLDRVEDTPS